MIEQSIFDYGFSFTSIEKSNLFLNIGMNAPPIMFSDLHNIQLLQRMWSRRDQMVEDAMNKSCVQQWDGSDRPENYKAEGNLYTPTSFSYRYNAHGFRCDEFDTDEKHDARILFLGCSFTSGTGLPLEEIYAHKIVSALRREGLKVPYWNAALGGRSGDWCTRVAYKLVPYLKPDIVFVLFPNIHRHEVFIPSSYPPESHCHYLHAEYVEKAVSVQSFARSYEEFFTDSNDLYHAAKNIAFMHLIAEAGRSRLLWSSWYRCQFELLLAGNPDIAATCVPHFVSVPGSPMARDSLHTGHVSHTAYAETLLPYFLDALKEIGNRPPDR